jgi:shikimate kinase
MNVVLIGMKHCGKSSIGAALAKRWGCTFYDVDPMIEAIHACETGETLTVREILARCGQDHFRRIEGHAVCDLYLKLDRPGSRSVVALGGRTALNATVCSLLNAIGLTVYLHVPPAEIYSRIERAGLPPFLDEDDPSGSFMRLNQQRDPKYRAIADLVVDLDGAGSVDEAVDRLIACIEEHGHARQ